MAISRFDKMVIDNSNDGDLVKLYNRLEDNNPDGENDEVLDAINNELDWRLGIADGQLDLGWETVAAGRH